jgi:hypothetical protein
MAKNRKQKTSFIPILNRKALLSIKILIILFMTDNFKSKINILSTGTNFQAKVCSRAKYSPKPVVILESKL